MREERLQEPRPRLDFARTSNSSAPTWARCRSRGAVGLGREAPPIFPTQGVRVVAGSRGRGRAVRAAYWLWGMLDVPQFLLFALVLLVKAASRVSGEAGRLRAELGRRPGPRPDDPRRAARPPGSASRSTRRCPAPSHARSWRRADGPRPSGFQKLGRLLHLLHTRDNQFFLPFALVLLWRTRYAHEIDALRRGGRPADRRLARGGSGSSRPSAPASYAADNPDDAFPEVVPGPSRFVAEGLGHPLIPLPAPAASPQ